MDDRFQKIKNDEYLSEFIRNNQLSDRMIENNLALFTRIMESRSRCRGCKGLNDCRQQDEGQLLALTFDQVVFEEIELCPYKRETLRKRRHLDNFTYCDIPEKLADIDLNNIRYADFQMELYALLLGILHGRSNKGLYISGDMGVGKTYLCIALANSLAKAGKKVAFVKVSEFLSDMKGHVGSYDDQLDRKINILKKTPYLILDDIGSEAVSEFVRDDILFTILDYRMENKLMTIFTSNLNISNLYKHYQFDRKDKENLPKSRRLVERIDILTDDYVLVGNNMRRI